MSALAESIFINAMSEIAKQVSIPEIPTAQTDPLPPDTDLHAAESAEMSVTDECAEAG